MAIVFGSRKSKTVVEPRATDRWATPEENENWL
jgi:hypothetical protein